MVPRTGGRFLLPCNCDLSSASLQHCRVEACMSCRPEKKKVAKQKAAAPTALPEEPLDVQERIQVMQRLPLLFPDCLGCVDFLPACCAVIKPKQ